MNRLFTNLVSIPWLWNFVQAILGAPSFKRELYTSVLTPGSRMLDFGCANGHLADAFIDHDYYGLDLDLDAIEAAKRRFQKKPNMHFIAADLHTKPFQKDFFNEILFAATVHYLTDELLKTLLIEMYDCLKSGGVIHIIDPVYQTKDGWQEKLMRRIDQGKYSRSLPQILAIIEQLELLDIGTATFHSPYGALLKDCDFVHLPLIKRHGT